MTMKINGYFSKMFTSACRLCHFSHFVMIFCKHNKIQRIKNAGKNYLPSLRFLDRKFLFKIANYQSTFKMFAAHFATNFKISAKNHDQVQRNTLL